MLAALAVAIIGLLLWLLTTGVVSVVGFVLLLVGGAFCVVDLLATAAHRPPRG